MYSQKSKDFTLQITSIDSIENVIILKKNYLKKLESKKKALAEIDQLLLDLKKNGYYAVKIDSLTTRKQAYKAYIDLGVKIGAARIKITNNSDSNLLPSTYTIEKNYIQIQPEEITNLLQTLSNRLSNQGKPFSKTTLKRINIKNSILYADLVIEQSKKRHLDSVIIRGYKNFPKNYIKHFYKLQEKTLFNQKKLTEISKQTTLLKFASELKPPEALFSKDSTLLYIYLNKKQANSVDGLVNFSSKENNKGVSFNGYIDLSLINAFNYGEELKIHWKNTGENKQFFKINTKIPYIFNTKVSAEASFNLYRHDSTFSNTTASMRLLLPINNVLILGLSYDSEKSENLLEQLNSNIESYSNNFIGTQLKYQSLHKNLFNIEINASLGKRTALAENNAQYKLGLTSSILLQLNQRLFLFLKNSSGYLSSKNYLQNELYRIGGIRSTRGFDEQSIFTSAYSLINSELRFSSQKKSYLYTVFDFGFFKNQHLRKNIYSFGLGHAFKTARNSFDINYVIGKHPETSLNVNHSKISIKMLTFF